ncbi:XrtY-associated glycosyltransferase XYAG1 [Pedobacter sp. MW01-1-1]|uniref:XrtY-associated glycosyltransferase XYAG1 n=1 Tax=Pedobacter sp. MW01-1-1 TaxID=3383027 RepID=UPI003FF00089
MKIIHITASYKPAFIYGGPVQSVAKLCEATTNLSGNHTIEVLCTTANGQEELAVQKGAKQVVENVSVTYYPRITKDHTHFSPALLWGLRKKIKSTSVPMVIHIHAWWNLVSIFSCWLAKYYRVPVVLSPRGMLTNYSQTNRNTFFKNLIHRSIGKKLLRYCHFHATSEQEKREIQEIIQGKSITVIPNLVKQNEEALNPKILEKEAPLKLIFLSRIEEKKGLEILFQALSTLSIPFTLSIGGSGKKEYVEALKKQAKNLNIAGKISWLGQVSDDLKFNVLQQHDVLVLSSYNENFANVVIESLSVGTAVLISKHVGLAEYISQHNLGWVTYLTPSSIQQALVDAAHNRHKLQEIQKQAPQLVYQDFNDHTLISHYMDLYAKVTSDPSTRL